MKKMWIIAAVACAALMVSCGGEKKGEKKAEDPIVVTAKEYKEKIEAAQKPGGSYRQLVSLNREFTAWFESLSDADQEKVVKELGLK